MSAGAADQCIKAELRKKSSSRRRRGVNRVQSNKRVCEVKIVKLTAQVDDENGLIKYVGSMSKAIIKLVNEKVDKRTDHGEMYYVKYELENAQSFITELKELVKMTLSGTCDA